MAERTDTGWRQDEPAPRWRALLDRALLGRGAPAEIDYDGRFDRPRGRDSDRTRDPANGFDDLRRDDLRRDDRRPDNVAREEARRGGPVRDKPGRGAPAYDDEPLYDAPLPRGYMSPGRSAPPEPVRVPPARTSPRQPPPDDRRPSFPPQIEWQPAAPADPTEAMVLALRQEITSPKVLAFANPKGGVHKTTATVLAAATIGSVRGRGVIAWDDNELRGTLGLRAGSARHARTVRHLIADLAEVENSSGYALHDRLDDYLRHASDGSYDVLAGEENPRFAQRLDPYTVRRVLELLRRTHDVICVDTGNNVESPNWQTVLQAADQLVVTTVPREDAAFTADWMLDLLDEAGMGELVANAVTLLSCPTPNPTPLIDDLAAHFASRTRAVVMVPYDPALEAGSSIEYPDLGAPTKRAWLRAAAVMMDSLTR